MHSADRFCFLRLFPLLSSLHVSEIWLVFEEAKRCGVNRICLTHPEEIADASMNDVKGLAAMGVFVEHSFCMFLEGSQFKCCEGEELGKHIEAAGVDKAGNRTTLGDWRQTGSDCASGKLSSIK